MSQAFDVCIRGAGIVGRSLALLLAQLRLRVALVQAPVNRAVDVRAYALNAASRQLLESLRCWPGDAAVGAVRQMRVWGDAGGELTFGPLPAPDDALAWIVDVPALEATLSQALQFAPQVTLTATPQLASLTVVCEGQASHSRAEFGVEFDAVPYGQHAVAARLACENPHQGTALQWFAQGEVLALLPLPAGESAQAGNSVALVWSVREDHAKQLCDASPEDFLAQLQAASQVQGQAALGSLQLLTERVRWPLQHAAARRWVGQSANGAWALCGDAAHAVHPLAGQGLNLGLADAAGLAQVLAARHGADYWRAVGDEKLLRRYERARRAALAPAATLMDGLQGLFAHPGTAVQRLRNLGLQGFERSGPLKDWVRRQAMGV
ncbi:MAG: hypothetical protein RLZZ401_981 [Pseudomonadota bacterium]|jgi:2-polyprenyl-6-methoxyphenol hydroxylase-like FAD-dependent oxidoreductase